MTENQTNLLEHAQRAARLTFEARGKLIPIITFIKGGKTGIAVVPFMANESDKHQVSVLLQVLRKDCEAVTFTVESWLGHNLNVKPRNDPNRTECILLSLFCLGEPTKVWTAEITRNPTTLGPWKEMDAVGLTGRFV